MDYLLGDLQGCCDALDEMLGKIAFSPSRDRLFVLGDIVNRGPRSLATLQRLRGLGDAARCLLGNHDLHLLAVAHGVRPEHANDTLRPILDSPERAQWIALRVLGDPDACPPPPQFLPAAARWRPWRAYAWLHLGAATSDSPLPETAGLASPRSRNST